MDTKISDIDYMNKFIVAVNPVTKRAAYALIMQQPGGPASKVKFVWVSLRNGEIDSDLGGLYIKYHKSVKDAVDYMISQGGLVEHARNDYF